MGVWVERVGLTDSSLLPGAGENAFSWVCLGLLCAPSSSLSQYSVLSPSQAQGGANLVQKAFLCLGACPAP